MPLSPVEYLERVCRITPYPVQAFLLKLAYGEPLDHSHPSIPIHDVDGNYHQSLTEGQYLTFLGHQGRVNIQEANPQGFQRISLATGRRAGKSTLITMIQLYEQYLFRESGRGTFDGVGLAPSMNMANMANQLLHDRSTGLGTVFRRTATSLTCGSNERPARFLFNTYGRFRSFGARFDLLTADETEFSNEIGVDALEVISHLSIVANPGARVIFTSTPHPSRTQQNSWHSRALAEPNWLALRIPTWEVCPDISQYRNYQTDFSANFSDSLAVYDTESVSRSLGYVRTCYQPPKTRFQVIEEFT